MTLWLVRGGKHGEQETIALDNSVVCIGWSEISDLSSAHDVAAIYEIVKAAYPDGPKNRWNNYSGQLNSFVLRMQKGDLVVLPLKSSSQIAIGRVSGPYEYRTDLGETHHTRKVEWINTEIPRTRFRQDLLYSFGAFMTVCRIKRNNAEERVIAILEGKPDLGMTKPTDDTGPEPAGNGDEEPVIVVDVEEMARDQIRAHMEFRFKGHDLARLVDAVLQAEGYVTQLSPPGPDGGVDVLARRGSLGFDGPKLCVQVKSSLSPADVNVFRGLQGTMATFKAEEGLLVSWSGFNRVVQKEARLSFFSVRLWDADDLLEAVQRNYDKLPEELQNELPMKRIWAIVPEE